MLGVLSVSAASVIIKFASADPLVIAFYRLAFSVILLSVPLVFQKSRHLSRKALRWSVVSGLFLAVHFATWFFSLKLTSVASSTVLVSTHPFLVMAYGYFFRGERVTRGGLLGIAAAVAGAVLVGWGDFSLDSRALLGDFLAVLGAVSFSGYFLIGKRVREEAGALEYSVAAYATASAALLGAALLAGNPLTGFDPINWSLFAALAIFPTIFGHTLFNWAIKYVPATVVSLNFLGEPVGASLLAWLIWRTVPTPASLVGAILILAGIGIYLRASPTT